MSDPRPQPDDADLAGGAWGTSLLFWACLLVASGLYGAVALSPKLLAKLKLDREYYNNQVELVRLEQQVQYLERVTQAFESDPQFAAEVARLEFNAARPGEERILVDERLALAPAESEPELPPLRALPWYAPLLEQLATVRTVRASLLGTATLVTLVAFGFLHDGRSEGAAVQPRLNIAARLRGRYRTPKSPKKRAA